MTTQTKTKTKTIVTVHPGIASIISMPNIKVINKKHPSKPAHPTVRANPEILPTTPVDHQTFAMNHHANFSMRMTTPACLTTLSAIPGSKIGRNPAYNVNACYYFFLVPMTERSKAMVLFQNNQLDELFKKYCVYVGQSETIAPSDRAGGRILEFKKDLIRYLTSGGAVADIKTLEASSRNVGKMMIANNHLYRESHQNLEDMIDCVYYSFSDMITMLSPTGHQLSTKWVESTMIEEYRSNGLLVNK